MEQSKLVKSNLGFFLGISLILGGIPKHCLAQDLGALLQEAGVDPAVLTAAQGAMGGTADPEAAREYSDGTKAGMAGDMNAAIAHLSRAVAIAPNFASAHFNLACAYSRNGEKSKALSALRKAVSIDAKYKSQAQSEADLQSLHQDPEFLAVVS